MGTADTVDAPVALHESHRVPGQIVVDDPSALLEVHTLGQNVGRHQDVIFIIAA